MDVNHPSAIKELIDNGVQVKTYAINNRGIFHPKLWVFESDEGWSCLIGSANLTEGGLRHNIEISVLTRCKEDAQTVSEARQVFKWLWNDQRCIPITKSDIEIWTKEREKREKLANVIRQLKTPYHIPDKSDGPEIKALESFVKDWIDIQVNVKAKTSSGNRLWRGWYVIPDHGCIDDDVVFRLHKICEVISKYAEGALDISAHAAETSAPFQKILKIVEKKLRRQKHKLNLRSLFVRAEKNYLNNLGFTIHPKKANGTSDKNKLVLTRYGKQIAQATTIVKQRKIYTRAVEECLYAELPLLGFIQMLMRKVDNRIDFIEFSFFVKHTSTMRQIDDVASLIKIYRAVPEKVRADFVQKMNDYFDDRLEGTGSGVKMNYDKSVRHIMSVFGWCEGLNYDPKSSSLFSARLSE